MVWRDRVLRDPLRRDLTPRKAMPPAAKSVIAVAALTLLCAVAGCRDAPEVVFESARAALSEGDEVAFLALCEPTSRDLITRGERVAKRSSRIFRVLADGHPTAALLPKGDVSETLESGHRAVVKVKFGGSVSNLPLRLVRGHWKLDLLEMHLFVDAMRPR